MPSRANYTKALVSTRGNIGVGSVGANGSKGDIDIEDTTPGCIEIELDRLHGCTELLLEDLCWLARVHLIR